MPFSRPAFLMNTRARLLLGVAVVLIGFHSILSLTHEDYGRATSLSKLTGWPSSESKPDYHYVEPLPNLHEVPVVMRRNATLVMLARNSDLEGVVKSMRRLEDRFNKDHHYPWVFLNEVEFSDEFKKRVAVITESSVSFGVIPHDHWYQPDWIDEDKATDARQKLESEGVIYGGSVPYRNMCRFNSGFFYRHELLQQYKWYWRVEPDVDFTCNINFDPFEFMEQNNKTYGFTIALKELRQTVETLWDSTKEFIDENPQYVAQHNAMNFLSDDRGHEYNLCHFWSNFEIADMDFWRGEAYSAYFDFLDRKGGFYYERWGDAPVHSIAASLFLPRERIHFFDPIGYHHESLGHCPMEDTTWTNARCACSREHTFDTTFFSCKSHWDRG